MPTTSKGASQSRPTPPAPPESGTGTEFKPAAAAKSDAKSNYSATSIAFRPLTELTVDDAVRELGALFSLSAVVVARSVQLYRWLADRGVKIELRSVVFRRLIPLVAEGKVSAEAVAAFADEPKVLNAAASLNVAEQVRLAGGGTIEVLTAIGGPIVPMTVCEAVKGNYPVIVAGQVLTAEQQKVQLQAREKAAARPAAPRTVSSESQVEDLARKLAEHMGRHNLTRLSAQAAAELCAAAGWKPGKADSGV